MEEQRERAAEKKDPCQILEEQKGLLKKQLFYARIHAAAGVVTAVSLLTAVVLLTPGLLRVLDQTHEVLTGAERAIEELLEVSENVNGLVESGNQAVQKTMEKVDQMDIERLNEAIDELNRVIEPLADFFGRFQ